MTDTPKVTYESDESYVREDLRKDSDAMVADILTKFMDELIRVARKNKGHLSIADLEGIKTDVLDELKAGD